MNKEIFKKSLSIVGLKVSKTLLKKTELPEKLRTFINDNKIEIIKHDIDLDYQNYSYEEVMKEVLPKGCHIPHAFEKIGHIAHLNLKEELLPYKNVIAQIIIDKKKPQIRTVLNKVGKIDTVFRTFNFELLAGDDDYMAEIKENECIFKFNFSEVYWNSRLQFEHSNLINTFKKSDIVVDMFAGVGPFAVPAAKLSQCTVYANDLNPSSVKYMRENAARNKARTLIEISNKDARDFIRDLVARKPPVPFTQVIMNLPSTSVEFLDVFRDIFRNPDSKAPINPPTIHCYTFTPTSDDIVGDTLRHVESVIGTTLPADTLCFEVRDVSPKKRMMRVSFKMPIIITDTDSTSTTATTTTTTTSTTTTDTNTNNLKRKDASAQEEETITASKDNQSAETTSTTDSKKSKIE
eukprot:gene1415-1638_t